MLIQKAYKFRLYPNQEQENLINKTLGSCRFIYNYYLEDWKNKKDLPPLKANRCIKNLPDLFKKYTWLKEIDKLILYATLFRLEDAFRSNFDLNFKSKYKKNTYRIDMYKSKNSPKNYCPIKLNLKTKTIFLSQLKQVKIGGYRHLDKITGKIINATISKEINRYYVSVLYEQIIKKTTFKPQTIIGLDLGIKDLVVTSFGEKITNQKSINKYEKRIKNIQKGLSKKRKGSNNYYKTIVKLKIVYRKLKNARKFHLHNITKKIIDENDLIITEQLQLKKLIEKKQISKYIADASLREIIRQLGYKSKWKNKKFYQIEIYYPSSQICHHCNFKNPLVKNLSLRNWTCPNCNFEHDRDINASINIMFKGLEKYLKESINN